MFEQRNLWNLSLVRSLEHDQGFDDRYLPENRAVFRLPCFWVRRKDLYVYRGLQASETMWGNGEKQGPDDRVLFPMHPAELRNHQEFFACVGAVDTATHGVRFFATPTSSTRTVLVWPDGQPENTFFAKLSLNSRLFGDRRLRRERVAGSVGLSRLVLESAEALPSGVKYFPEKVGLAPRWAQEGGVIIRVIPEEIKAGRVVPAPLFALIGGDQEHRPLLLELMARGEVDIREFIESVLLEQFADNWVDLVFESGLILEAHGQDLLLALSPNLIPLGGLYYRDFEGLTVDWSLRRVRGLSEPSSLPHAWKWFETYETWGYPLLQLVFGKLRTSLFDYLYFFLSQFEIALAEWRANGGLIVAKDLEGRLTFLFSHYLRRAIHRKFGLREPEEYDIQRDLNRFVKFLLRVRREVMLSNAGGC